MEADSQLFEAVPTDGYEWIVPRRETDMDAFVWLEGPLDTFWQSPRMTLLKTDERGRRVAWASMPWLVFNVLVLRDEAIDRSGLFSHRTENCGNSIVRRRARFSTTQGLWLAPSIWTGRRS